MLVTLRSKAKQSHHETFRWLQQSCELCVLSRMLQGNENENVKNKKSQLAIKSETEFLDEKLMYGSFKP